MNICVFCSANGQIDQEYFTMAEELGAWAAHHGHTIVFGGHDAGLMHAVSKAAKAAGGHVIGVVPRRIEEMGRLSPYLDEHITTENLTDRKEQMMNCSDVFIVMPGGIGTLDELFTTAAAATLQYHRKPVILWNMNGFWNSFVTFMDDLGQKGVMRGEWRNYIMVADSLAQITEMLSTTESLPL